MGAGLLTLNGTDVTSKTDLESFEAEFQANRLNGVMDAVLKSVLVKEQDEVILTDGGVRIFGGRVAIPTPTVVAGTVYTKVKAVSFDVLLEQRVIESGERTGSRYDDDDAKWIVGYHAELLSNTYVARLRTDVLPSIDYSGMTLRQALDHLATYTTGAAYWVDENKQLHWTDPQSAQLIKNTGWDGGASTNWSLDGSASVTADAGPGGTGDYALVTTGNSSGMHETTQTVAVVVGSRRYLFQADLWSSVASKAQVRLDWQNSGGASQRIDTLTNSGATSTWNRYKSVYTAPAAATKVVIRPGGVNNFSGTVRHDNLTLVGEDAAFGIDTSPDGSTTFAPERWKETREAVVPINRVLVIGNGISGWREHAASIAYFGGKKFEGVIKDDRVTTTDGIDTRAAFVFRKYAFPGISGSYVTRQPGLKAGTWQLIRVVSADGIMSQLSIVYLTTIKTHFAGANAMEYEVTYGEPEDDAGGAMASIESSFAGIVPVPGGPPANEEPPGQDSTAPATPTGLALTTGTAQQPDGGLSPYLQASWNQNGDADLDAYELAIDRAITGKVTFSVSASGSGGSLPAGTYAVNITGNGAVAGESEPNPSPLIQVVTAGQRLYVNITAKTGMASYRAYASILATGEQQPKLTGQTAITTTGSNVEITAAGSGAYPPSSSTAVAFINPTTVRLLAVSYYTEALIGNTYYAARLRALDTSGNESGWTAIQGIVVGKDTSAPAVPQGLNAIPGHLLVGLAWQRNSEPDLDKYQLRYTTDDPLSADADWTPIDVSGTSAVITGLEGNVATYWQVRSVDRSGNTATSEQVSTAVNAANNPAAGWSNTAADTTGGYSTTLAATANAGATNIKVASVTNAVVGQKLRVGTSREYVTILVVGTAGSGGTGLDITPAIAVQKASGQAVVQVVSFPISAVPSLLGSADFAADSIIARTIDANSITADDITTGTLRIGGLPDAPDYLLVYNASGQEIGRWDANGLLIKDPANPFRQMRFLNGALSFSSDGGTTWTTSITAEGINADAILLGAIPGGHNAIPNPGFELTAFAQLSSRVWTSSGDWGTTIGTDVNLNKSSGSLQMAEVSYAGGGPPGPTVGYYGTQIGSDTVGNIQIGGEDGGGYNTKVSQRFIPQHSGYLNDIRIWYEIGDNYSGGTGGSRRLEVRTDNNGPPSNTVLASENVAANLDRVLTQSFSSPAYLEAGTPYHIVYINTDADPYVNFISSDNQFQYNWHTPRQPGVFTGWACYMDQGAGWVERHETPILQLHIGSAYEGIGLMDLSQTTRYQTINGANNMVRERFTVSGGDKTVTGVYVRLGRTSGTDALILRLEDNSGNLIDSVSVAATSVAIKNPAVESSDSTWVGGAFSSSHVLSNGTTYRLRLSTASGTTYTAYTIRQGSSWGFNAGSYFADGVAEYTTNGSTWNDMPPTGGATGEGDLQFYFTLAV